MNFSQLKLIFDSFSRSSFLVAISASTLQAGANESPRVCCVHMALVNHYAVHPRRSLSNGEPGGVRIHPRRFLSLKDKCGQPVEGDRIYLHDRRACRRTCQIVSACIIVHQDGRVNLIDRPVTNLWAVHPPESAICPLDSENRLYLYSALEGILYFSHKDLYVSANA